MPKTLNTSEFIKRAQDVHQNYFNYSCVVYTNMHTKVKIIDPILGEFFQTPFGHLQGQGHPGNRYIKAANKRRMGKDEFVVKANQVHDNLYDYSKVVYEHCDKKVCIVDPEFGEFWQSPYQHLRSYGCPARTKEKKWLEHEDHIIPLSIIRSNNKGHNKWHLDRPLYKFLNSNINLQKITSKFNQDKTDFVNINGTQVNASSIRNNYDLIGYLIKTLLGVDPTDVIAKDQQFVNSYFGL
jgi:hypothetical protein